MWRHLPRYVTIWSALHNLWTLYNCNTCPMKWKDSAHEAVTYKTQINTKTPRLSVLHPYLPLIKYISLKTLTMTLGYTDKPKYHTT